MNPLISTLFILPEHWLIIPTNGNKQPLGYQWQLHPFSPSQMAKLLTQTGAVQVLNKHRGFYPVTPQGIGLLCGQTEPEFLLAVDVDGESAHAKIQELSRGRGLPKTVAFTSGRPGRAQYLFSLPGINHQLKSCKISTAPGEALELRGTGLQSVLPPSPHPLTGSYKWLPHCRPDQADVAHAPQWAIDRMTNPVRLSELLKMPRHSHFKKTGLRGLIARHSTRILTRLCSF